MWQADTIDLKLQICYNVRMNSQSIQDTIMGVEVVFKATMELYDSYFKTLETAIINTPDSELARIMELNDLTQEAETALEADLALFERIAGMDEEGLLDMQEELKIQAIYKKLKP